MNRMNQKYKFKDVEIEDVDNWKESQGEDENLQSEQMHD